MPTGRRAWTCRSISLARSSRLGRCDLQPCGDAMPVQSAQLSDQAPRTAVHRGHRSNLVEVSMDADLDERAGVNRPGFTLHSGVLRGRPDVNCSVHVHPDEGVAISALKHGLRPGRRVPCASTIASATTITKASPTASTSANVSSRAGAEPRVGHASSRCHHSRHHRA